MILFIAIFACINLINCIDVDSYEVNRLENDYSPFYDMIVYSDIVDILNEFDTKGGHPIEAFVRSESDSDENVNDLLSEYQRHIDKIAYEIETVKNRAPTLRRNSYPTDIYNPMRLPKSRNPNLIDFLIPLNQWAGYKPDTWKVDSVNRDDVIQTSFSTPYLSPTVHKSMFDKSCFCKNNKLPCQCDCKLCIMPLDMLRQNPLESRALSNDLEDINFSDTRFQNYNTERMVKDFNDEQSKAGDNTLNIKIKFEIQMPETSNVKGKHCRNHTKIKSTAFQDGTSIEITPRTVSVPSSYMQYPIPLEIFGLNKKTKTNRPQSIAMHKVGIHKRKKSKFNNKHRKKVVTFHDIKLEAPQRLLPVIEESPTISVIDPTRQNISVFANGQVEKDPEQKATQITTTETATTMDPHREEKITFTLNLLNDRENTTDEIKYENQIIEADADEIKANATYHEDKVTRRKRDIAAINKELENKTPHIVKHFPKLKGQKIIIKDKDATKKYELKSILADSELLFWPSNIQTHSVADTKNITTLIVERETKKAKVNISKDIIKNNHTKALEKAIFGDVNWDDMDAVAPIFMSFVGKYLRGVLTFCSENVCHSMKCAEKVCLHRTCKPNDRLNHKGHCAVSNTTDSAVSMESIMDLPSNVAFEIVDILQDNMPGKIYGKGTICISNKCISFVAAKKLFSKSRCSIKDLNTLGHCSNIKNFKSVN